MPEPEFCDLAETNGVKVKYCYYLTGPLGVGKSTAISSLGSLHTFDEWMEPRIPLLAELWTDLTKTQRRTTDRWIDRQFKLKNDNVRKVNCGIYVLDRAPLDPLAFTPKQQWAKRANELLSAICPAKTQWQVEPGCIFLLTGDHEEMSLRMRLTSREKYTGPKLQRMELELRAAYGESNVVVIDTKGLIPAAVVNRVARWIHLEDYEPISLHDRLKRVAQKGR
jgi:hypothetical protein